MTETMWELCRKKPKTHKHLHRAGVKVSLSTVQRLREQQYRGYTTRCKPFISSKNWKASSVGLHFAKMYIDEPHKFWNKVLWTYKTKINLYQSDGKVKVWRTKGSAYDRKHTISTVKHWGGSGLGLHGCFCSGFTNLYWWCNSWW